MGNKVSCNKCWGKHERSVGWGCTAVLSETCNTDNTSINNSNTIIPSAHRSPITQCSNIGAGNIATVLQRMNEMANAMVGIQTELRLVKSDLAEAKAATPSQPTQNNLWGVVNASSNNRLQEINTARPPNPGLALQPRQYSHCHIPINSATTLPCSHWLTSRCKLSMNLFYRTDLV